MITIFAIPKPFRGHFGVIQRNAIASWVHLDIHPEVILFGDDEGTAEVAHELGVKHIPVVAKNEFGTPLLSDVFAQAQQQANNSLVCYINADIILLNDFGRALPSVSNLRRPFLMTGRRWDTDITEILNFDEGYEPKLHAYALAHGSLHSLAGLDYFVFPRHFLDAMPAFAVGRPTWDNWTLYHVRKKQGMLIDATQSIFAIHQNHDYSHHAQGLVGVTQGAERQQNFELTGGWNHIFTLLDATHLLTPTGIKPASSYPHMRRRIVAFGILNPRYRLFTRILNRSLRLLDPSHHE